jgi:hypothetical protein
VTSALPAQSAGRRNWQANRTAGAQHVEAAKQAATESQGRLLYTTLPPRRTRCCGAPKFNPDPRLSAGERELHCFRAHNVSLTLLPNWVDRVGRERELRIRSVGPGKCTLGSPSSDGKLAFPGALCSPERLCPQHCFAGDPELAQAPHTSQGGALYSWVEIAPIEFGHELHGRRQRRRLAPKRCGLRARCPCLPCAGSPQLGVAARSRRTAGMLARRHCKQG